MKLIRCKKCNDVVRLIHTKWRTCDCGKSGGQYNDDLLSATVGGKCDIVGISNLFFDDKFRALSDKEKVKFRKKINHHYQEIWYWELLGDFQIHRIKSPEGPRLKIKIKRIDDKNVKLIFKDKRKYSLNIPGDRSPKSIVIESPMISSFKEK